MSYLPKNTRILFINPATGLDGFLPIGLSSLIAVLHTNGFAIDIFDTTYYETTDYDDRKKNEFVGEFIPIDVSKYDIVHEKKNYIKDLNEKIKKFKPHLIAVAISTSFNFPLATKLISGISDFTGLIVVGGKCVTVSPHKFTSNPKVDILCIGEGEHPLLELCNCIEKKQQHNDLKSLWIRNGDSFIKNELAHLPDLDTLPYPNWDFFDKRHFLKPFVGRMYRYGHIELSRGCPHRCSYCINEKLQELCRGKGPYYRKKSIQRALDEIKHLKDTYKLEMVKFWDEEFLLRSVNELEEFAAEYKHFNLPFLITARLDSCTDRKVALLKEMGCVNVSAGIESGSEYLKKHVLNRKMTNKQAKEGIRILNKHGIRTTTLNMLGIPHETRKQVFETINLNREAKTQNSSLTILQPWEGTKIREIAVKAGFMNDDCENYDYTDTHLIMPQLPPDEIRGLAKTFSLYRRAPKIVWPLVWLCEKNNEWRNRLFSILIKIFK